MKIVLVLVIKLNVDTTIYIAFYLFFPKNFNSNIQPFWKDLTVDLLTFFLKQRIALLTKLLVSTTKMERLYVTMESALVSVITKF